MPTQPYATPGASLRALTVRTLTADDQAIPDLEIWVQSPLTFGALGKTDAQGEVTGYVKDGSYRIMVLVNENYYQPTPSLITIANEDKSVDVLVVPVSSTNTENLGERVATLEEGLLALRSIASQKLGSSEALALVRNLTQALTTVQNTVTSYESRLSTLLSESSVLLARYPDLHWGTPVDSVSDLPSSEDAVLNQVLVVIGTEDESEFGLYRFSPTSHTWERIYSAISPGE